MINVARLLRDAPASLAVVARALAIAPALALTALLAAAPPAAAMVAASQSATRAGEWWLTTLQVPAAWRDAPQAGKGVTVAVLSTGVDAKHQDLTGAVIQGPDLSGTGRTPGNAYWGAEGTAVASLIAGHGHGTGGTLGITGIAPDAKILSVQVTLEYNDPLNSDPSVTSKLPSAIAAGIRYAVSHGATVIALPLDPGNLGAAPAGDPAAGGDAAERAAVSFALAHNVVLVAPAGDNGAGTNAVNYPAAYPGVIAVGATSRSGQLSLFTNTGSYVSLTAPGSGATPDAATVGGVTANPAAGIAVAAPDGGYESLASSDMSAALTAGTAALIRSRYPGLTAAQVTQALEHGAARPGSAMAPGWGHGRLDAATALAAATATAAAHPAATPTATRTAAPAVTPSGARSGADHARPAAVGHADPGRLLRSLSVDLVAAACALIAVLIAAIALTRARRRARGGPGGGAGAGSRSRKARRARRARHAKGQRPVPGTVQPARVTMWPSAPGALGTLGTPGRLGTPGATAAPPAAVVDPVPGPGNLGPAGGYRRPRPASNPPWAAATPPRSPEAPPVMLPAQPELELEPVREQKPPWESEPADFTAPPAVEDTGPWPISTTGPMYVWNPAATGPIIVLGTAEEEQEDDRDR